MTEFFINFAYLAGTLGFVFGLRLLSSPDTARKGNTWAAIGMGIAIVAALIAPIEGAQNNYGWIMGGMIVGGAIGWISANKIQMTAMPQMVSVFNGLGGACAVVLGLVEIVQFDPSQPLNMGEIAIVLSTLFIGSVSFTGSLLAFAKLQGLIWDDTLRLPAHNIINIVLLIITLGVGVYAGLQMGEGDIMLAYVFIGLALVYGFSFVIPIGGADMPVVISLLNSLTGLSAAAAGLIYGNNLMLVGGILVGASGTILTVLMTEAMNRSLLNVLIGGFGGSSAAVKGADGDQIAKQATANDVAIQLFYSQSVIFVPGYGLAVAQAQKALKEVEDMLEANGVEVKYAIHPVAGRMPGHMNVLLAEADVPYPKLLDLEDANSALKDTDIVVIVGANDVVNPAAEDDPASPIYGMPVLQVWNAKHSIVIKRSMSPGYAGIPNPLFFGDKNRMLFGDAKKVLVDIAGELKGL